MNIVLLHAFPLNHHLWDAQAQALRAAGHQVLAPDLPGFGSSPIGEPSLEAYASAVLEQADAAGFDEFVLGGLSMGGYTAMAILRQTPERVQALILADTRASADSVEGAAGRLARADELDAGLDLEVFSRAIIPTLVGPTTLAERPEVIDTVRGWIEANPPATIANALRALAARPDSVTELEAFKRPALIVWGEEDTLTNRDDQEPMLDALDDVELAIIASAGHLSSVESPDAVSAVLLDFIESLG